MSFDGEPIRVLCVDDEPGLADLTALFLERFDEQFSTETATSAQEGLAFLEQNDVDCIVSDHDMPGMDGLEFLQAVRATNPDLPFILFTGRGSEDIASDAISAGVSDYMQKKQVTNSTLYSASGYETPSSDTDHAYKNRKSKPEPRSS